MRAVGHGFASGTRMSCTLPEHKATLMDWCPHVRRQIGWWTFGFGVHLVQLGFKQIHRTISVGSGGIGCLSDWLRAGTGPGRSWRSRPRPIVPHGHVGESRAEGLIVSMARTRHTTRGSRHGIEWIRDDAALRIVWGWPLLSRCCCIARGRDDSTADCSIA